MAKCARVGRCGITGFAEAFLDKTQMEVVSGVGRIGPQRRLKASAGGQQVAGSNRLRAAIRPGRLLVSRGRRRPLLHLSVILRQRLAIRENDSVSRQTR
jgi:hypothetical protein